MAMKLIGEVESDKKKDWSGSENQARLNDSSNCWFNKFN